MRIQNRVKGMKGVFKAASYGRRHFEQKFTLACCKWCLGRFPRRDPETLSETQKKTTFLGQTEGFCTNRCLAKVRKLRRRISFLKGALEAKKFDWMTRPKKEQELVKLETMLYEKGLTL